MVFIHKQAKLRRCSVVAATDTQFCSVEALTLTLPRHHFCDGSIGFGYFSSIVKHFEGGEAPEEDSTASFIVPFGSLSQEGMVAGIVVDRMRDRR